VLWSGPLVAALLLLGASALADEARFALGDGTFIEGAPLGDPASPLGAQGPRIARAILAELNVDADRVPVHVVKNTDLPRVHKALGGRVGVGWELSGFELSGHVFVKRGLATVPDSVLVHEVLHALSERFAASAHAVGCHNLVEGIDQWLTLRVTTRQLHLQAERKRTYGGYTDFAEVLAERLGADQLTSLFVKGRFAGLESEIDARRGPATLRRACRALEDNDFTAAMRGVAPPVASGDRSR
jgi:hypothetical protein